MVSLVRDYGIEVVSVIYPDLKGGRGTEPSQVAKLQTLIDDLNNAIGDEYLRRLTLALSDLIKES